MAAVWLAGCVQFVAPGPCAAQTASAKIPPPPEADAEAAPDPNELRQRVHLTVESNLPPAKVETNATLASEKHFRWSLSWEGWNGLDFEMWRRTLLGQVMPGVTNAEEALTARSWLGHSPPTNAFRLHLEDARLSLNLGARFDIDAAAYVTGSQFQGFDNGLELRRARLIAKGDCVLVMPVSYQLEIGYVPHTFSLQDSFLVFQNLDLVGDLKVGQFQPPMGLEAITSSRDSTYMELAAPIQALAPGSDAGFQLGRPIFDDRLTWRFGLFGPGVGQDVGDASQDFARAIMRFTGLPIYDFDPKKPYSTRLLHLGLSANVLYSGDSTVRYQSRPESYQAPYVVNTGDIDADGALVVGGEAAWVNGPFSIQGEFLHSFVRETLSTNGTPTLNFNGFYASASWFLTGESRPYDRRRACFGRVIPKHDFDLRRGTGLGALELAARYSYVDLNSDNVRGGRMSMLMTSLNWYLQPHVVLRFEYGFGHVSDFSPSGNINVFQTRLQLDF